MPNKTIYIRREDEELWEKLPKKAEAISKMLRGQNLEEVMVVETPTMKELGDKKLERMATDVPKDSIVRIFNHEPMTMEAPKHEWAKEKIASDAAREVVLDDPDWDKKYSDGELPCCKKAKPCVHWTFDGEAWVNQLSGKKKEIE